MKKHDLVAKLKTLMQKTFDEITAAENDYVIKESYIDEIFDEDLHYFMIDEFGVDYEDDEDAQYFQQMKACDVRRDYEIKLRDWMQENKKKMQGLSCNNNMSASVIKSQSNRRNNRAFLTCDSKLIRGRNNMGKQASQYSMKLFCGRDPQTLGIEDDEGVWDMSVFRAHIESCDICGCGVGKIMGMMASVSSTKKATSSRENGKKGGRPRKLKNT